MLPSTLFENHPKCRISIFEFWHFPAIFVLLKLICLVTLFDRKLQIFKSSPKLTIFGIFKVFLSTQNVNVACFARNVEWNFFCDFQTLWFLWWFWILFKGQSSVNVDSPLNRILQFRWWGHLWWSPWRYFRRLIGPVRHKKILGRARVHWPTEEPRENL